LVVAMLEQDIAADWGAEDGPDAQARALLSNAIASASLCVLRQGCVPPTRDEVQARMVSAPLAYA
jgi:hypothetical protein